jgi:pSer/pThr/pTyr-binding forkhead associated (FHA) protein
MHAEVSRHHCLFEIDPPYVRVLDLGSLTGTFVNGKRVGGRLFERLPDGEDPIQAARVELEDGDEVRIGSTLFSVLIDEATTQPVRWPELIRDATEIHVKGTQVANRQRRSNPRGANRGSYWTPLPPNGPVETNSPCGAPHGIR